MLFPKLHGPVFKRLKNLFIFVAYVFMYVFIIVCNFRSVQLEKKNAPEYASSENTIQVHSLQLIGNFFCGSDIKG